jgi:hypothetical protein
MPSKQEVVEGLGEALRSEAMTARENERLKTALARAEAQIIEQAGALEALRIAWDDLCRCTDEFLPEYPEACGEYQAALDAAVCALLDSHLPPAAPTEGRT